MMIEIAKLRRTKTLLLGLVLSAGIILFASMNLFAGGQIEQFMADPHSSWGGYLVGFSMAQAFLAPLQLALIASRVVDAEHASGGWRLNAVAGTRPGALLVRKFGVAGLIVAVLKAIEFAAVLGLPIALGAPAPDGEMLGTWFSFGLGATGTSLALLAVMLFLAAIVDSQIVVLAVGVVGGFLGIAALLSPTWLAAINPFGYFAVLTPFNFAESGVEAVQAHWPLWAGYLVIVSALFGAGTKVLDRKEI
ncbi:ABC-2 family transporter protein [Corynebacterium glaucum]|uniref:ABC-2 family transporter protein n=1 Tax=Corynebacterium glaucum TaxID=187491 RepID=A0A1Q2HW37_9CORY|nr:ABC transporter permease [Corynebacterium glaucum]AQQ15053.1 ABC-2 family transporter protein [Corynebacterium glaucum]